MSPDPRQWPRDRYVRAVWQSDLRPLERLVALVYADHARDEDVAWVTYPRIRQRTGLSSNGSVTTAVTGLRDAGWLELVEPGSGRRAARYRIAIPPGAGALGEVESTESRWSTITSPPSPGGRDETCPLPTGGHVPASAPIDAARPPIRDASPPSPGADQSSDHSSDRTIDRSDPHAPEARGADAEAAAVILAKHRELDEDDAMAAIAGIWAWSSTAAAPVKDIVRFARSRTIEELQGYAARSRRPASPSRTPTRSTTTETGPRCTVCGKVEARCIAERPGPDDHAFTINADRSVAS